MNLPAGSQVWVALGVDLAWTSEAHLTAAVVDALNGANWQRGDGKGKKPDPIPRPTDLARKAASLKRNFERAEQFAKRTRER